MKCSQPTKHGCRSINNANPQLITITVIPGLTRDPLRIVSDEGTRYAKNALFATVNIVQADGIPRQARNDRDGNFNYGFA